MDTKPTAQRPESPLESGFRSACMGLFGLGLGLLGLGLMSRTLERPATPSRAYASAAPDGTPSDASAPSGARPSALIAAFVSACGLGRPDAAGVSDRVGRMNLTRRMGVRRPVAGGGFATRKVWTGALGGDLLGVFVDETRGRGRTTSGCAVASKVPDVDAFRGELVETLRLTGVPVARASADRRSFEWKGAMGKGTEGA